MLSQITTPKRKRCVSRTGWHPTDAGYVYIMAGGETFGAGGSDVILQTDRAAAAEATRPRGTLAGWQDYVARFAVGNYRLALFISAAFAAPLLDIVSEPSGGLHMHGSSQTGKTTALSAAALARYLRAATRLYYGTAARAFVEQLARERNDDAEGLIDFIAKSRQAFHNAHMPAGADGQVISVGGRFGLIAVAGELATAFGVLPWPPGEATRAAAAGFEAWLGARGGAGAAEDAQAITMVRKFIEQHEESRFSLLTRVPPEAQASRDETRAARQTINRVGFRRETSDGRWEFLIFPESWKSEVCKGLDAVMGPPQVAGFGKRWLSLTVMV